MEGWGFENAMEVLEVLVGGWGEVLFLGWVGFVCLYVCLLKVVSRWIGR